MTSRVRPMYLVKQCRGLSPQWQDDVTLTGPALGVTLDVKATCASCTGHVREMFSDKPVTS